MLQPNDTSVTSAFPTVPGINITLNLASLNLESFTDYLKQQTADALGAAFPPSVNLDIYILNVRAGSVVCTVVFGVMDGNTTSALSGLEELTNFQMVRCQP